MDETARLAIRDRKAGDSLTVIPAPVPSAWEHTPREPHLLDYLIILRKHQWLILTFLLTVVSLLQKIARLPRVVCFSLQQDLAVRILGGYSLLVLAK
jgi:hypothetical protein